MSEQGKNQKVADALGGILILGALPGSPAAQWGLRYGDVLVAVNGVRTQAVEAFLEARSLSSQRMRLEVIRGGQAITLDLDISNRTSREGLQGVTSHLADPAPPSDRGNLPS